MTPQELKNSILQLAIQGKLVEQRPEEGSGGELLERIFAAKNAKYAKGAKKNSRAETPRRRGEADAASSREEIPDSEKPFDIPESWVWVRIGELGASTDTDSFCDGPFGSNLKTSHHISYPEVRIIQLSNIGEDGWKDKNVKYTSFRHLETVIPRCEVHPGDFVIAKMMPAGRTIQVPELGTRITLGSDAMKFVPHPMLNKQFLLYAMRSQVFLGQVYAEAHGITRVRTTLNSVKSYVLPLPPLAEQKRIVAKIEELLPLIDRYEKAWSKLEDFNKRFPVDMQKSLLQMAIQGKLVEQRAEEGTAAELVEKILAAKNAKGAKKNSRAETQSHREKKSSALSASPREEIPDDEKPFDIPESWEWVRLSSVTDMLSGFAFKSTDFKANGKYRLLRGINLGVDDVRWKETVYVDYITERMAEYRLKSGDVLIGLDRPWISDGTRVAIFNDSKETYLVQRVLRLRETGLLTSAFIALLLRSSLLSNSIGDKTTGISVPHISPGQVGNLVIPLPPLAEQKRIVAKLEELLPLCERLK